MGARGIQAKLVGGTWHTDGGELLAVRFESHLLLQRAPKVVVNV